MKKLSFSLLALLGLFATVFISCDEDEDGIDILPPTIEAPDEPIIDVGETANLSFSITTPGGFQSASIASSGQNIATATINSQPTPGPSSSGTIEVAVTGVAPGEATLVLTVTDREAQSETEDLVVTVE